MDGISRNFFWADTSGIHVIYRVLFSDGLKDGHFPKYFHRTGKSIFFFLFGSIFDGHCNSNPAQTSAYGISLHFRGIRLSDDFMIWLFDDLMIWLFDDLAI
jgi:hypothetical protein